MKAASVLPEPVGAATRVWVPRAIAGHPSACAPVGASKRLRNHSRISGWNCASTSDIGGATIVSVALGNRTELLCYYTITVSRVKAHGSTTCKGRS